VLVDGDPTKNIEDVRKVSAVITRGYLIYRGNRRGTGHRTVRRRGAETVTTAVAAAAGGGNEARAQRIEATPANTTK
jgi:hypothetical protein